MNQAGSSHFSVDDLLKKICHDFQILSLDKVEESEAGGNGSHRKRLSNDPVTLYLSQEVTENATKEGVVSTKHYIKLDIV